ncbi:MAG: hypothetical protein ABI888_04130 [Chloroflexota bacterium]
MPSASSLDPIEILRALVAADVRFVVIGGIAGALQGSTTLTADLDILYDRDRDNIERLAGALKELDAKRRDLPDGVSARVDTRAILSGMNLLMSTRAGDLDCIAETPSGRFTYPQIAPTADRLSVERGLEIEVASLDELIRMKRATGREKDRIEVETLAALREERERRDAR